MATEKIIKIKVEKNGADNSVKELDKNIKKTDASTSGLSGSLDKVSGGALSAFKAMKVGLSSAVSGFKSLKFAIIATGIGALIIGILAVKQAFTASEEGQNKFAKIMGVIGAITGNLIDLLSDFGEFIIGMFSGDSKAIKSLKSFGKFFFDTLGLPIKNTITTIKTLGKALADLFSGDISGAFDSLKNGVVGIKDNFLDAKDAVNGATNAVKEFGEQNIREGKAAAKVADNRAKADKIERDLIIDKANAENEIAKLRLIAKQQNKFSAKEREDALIKAGEIQDELISREGEVLKLRAESITLENTFARSNKENLTSEAQAIAAVIKAETARTNFKRQLARELTAAQNEQESERKAKLKAKELIESKENKKIQKKLNTESKLEEDRLKKISKIQEDFKKKNEDLEDEENLAKLERQYDRDLIELERLDATEQQKYELKKYYDGLISTEEQKIIQDSADSQKKAKSDAEDQRLKEAEDQIKLEQSVSDAKNNIANRTANLLMELGGKAAKVGKAIAVAQTIRSGIEGVQNAYTTAQGSPVTKLFPAYPIVQAGLAGAFSALQVKKILSTPETGGGGGANNSRGGETGAPSFNLVQGTQQDQLQQSINASNDRPLQAIVVSSSVTNAQQANRNKYEESSI
jgi:hypothetical protein